MKNIMYKWGGSKYLLGLIFLLILCIQITPVYSIMNEVKHSSVMLGPRIQVDMPVTDFGDVPINSSKTLDCKIINIGDSDLTINRIYFTGFVIKDFQAKPNVFDNPLKSRESKNVEIIFKPDSIKYRDVTLNVESNATISSNFQIRLKGKGVEPKPITVKPDTINFGNVPVDSVRTDSFRIMNNSNNDMGAALIKL